MALEQYSFRFSDLVQSLTIIIALGKEIGTFLNPLVGVLTQQNCGLHHLDKRACIVRDKTRLVDLLAQLL